MEMKEPMRAVVMACSARKRKDVGLMPAERRYDGSAWRVLHAGFRAAEARAGVPPTVVVLSAEFGFIAPGQPIPDYDQLMDPARAAEFVADPRQRRALVDLLGDAGTVFLGGGALYRDTTRRCLDAAGYRATLVDPVPNRGSGDQLGGLRRFLLV